MEEILELKGLIQQQDYQNALLLVEQMEEMGRKAIINQVYSYIVVLLLHLLLQSQ
jgi:ribosomal protein S17E